MGLPRSEKAPVGWPVAGQKGTLVSGSNWERHATAVAGTHRGRHHAHALALGEFYAVDAERVYGAYGGTPEARMAGRVLDWIKRAWTETFTERDLYRALGIRRAEASGALALLEETGHVRPAADATGDSEGQPGRKPSPTWEVNPLLRRGSVESVNSVAEVRT